MEELWRHAEKVLADKQQYRAAAGTATTTKQWNQSCSRGETRGERRSSKYFVRERRSPKLYQDKGERWYSSVLPSRLAKKCKEYGKLILRKIIKIIAAR